MELLFSIGGKSFPSPGPPQAPQVTWMGHRGGLGCKLEQHSLMSKAWEFHKQTSRQLHPTQVGDGRTNC